VELVTINWRSKIPRVGKQEQQHEKKKGKAKTFFDREEQWQRRMKGSQKKGFKMQLSQEL